MYNGASLSSQDKDNDDWSLSNICIESMEKQDEEEEDWTHSSKAVRTTGDKDRVFDQAFDTVSKLAEITVGWTRRRCMSIINDRRNTQLEKRTVHQG